MDSMCVHLMVCLRLQRQMRTTRLTPSLVAYLHMHETYVEGGRGGRSSRYEWGWSIDQLSMLVLYEGRRGGLIELGTIGVTVMRMVGSRFF